MFKRILCIMLCLMLLGTTPALAAVKTGKHVQLVVADELLTLNSQTGYVTMDGSKTYIPIAAVAEALGCTVEFNAKKSGVAITTAEGDVIKAVKSYRMITVNGTERHLKARTIRHKGVLLAHVSILPYLGAEMSAYPCTAELRQMGYDGPTMVINRKGLSTLPPERQTTADSFAADLEAAQTATQIIAVQYTGSSRATLTYHEKKDGVWQQLLSCNAVVGKNGIGKALEGDKKTPRGTYALTSAFGIEKNPGTAMEYTRLTKDHYWNCTVGSEYYNQLVDVSQVDYTPTAADEHLRDSKGYYDYAIVLDYNHDCVPGKGSAIFLHCSGSKKTTNGCIAIPEEEMMQLLQMLEPGAKIVIF